MSRVAIEVAPISSETPTHGINSEPNNPSFLHAGELSIGPEDEQRSLEEDPPAQDRSDSKWKTAGIIACVTCFTVMNSFLAAVVVVSIPVIATDLRLGANLVLWPASIYSLTCGCTLLLLGSVADIVGSRLMYLLGCFLQCAFTLACGLSRTGTQLIVFRGFSGIAASFCLPSTVSIVNNTFPAGRRRSLTFASMGGGLNFGFGIGLILGGIFADTIGWRWGFYLAAILNLIMLLSAAWYLPKSLEETSSMLWQRLVLGIDWVGTIIASSSLAMLSYVLASVTSTTSEMRSPVNISLLSLALALIPAFVFWVGRQDRLKRPALIPNALWQSKIFTSICVNVFLIWGAFNAFEQILSFFFQDAQRLSALQTALRFLPAPISGVLANLIMALIVYRVRADWIVITATIISCIAPLLMAVVNLRWSYWACAFPAIFLNPIAEGALFTTSNLLITSVFPAKTQALAGGVFNTISQIGKSVSLALAALITNSVTARSSFADKQSPEALMKGYHATFWFCFALNAATIFVSVLGLRKIGNVGIKKE